MAITSSNLTKEKIRKRLKEAYTDFIDCPYPPGFFNKPPRLAAVLMPLLFHNSAWHLLFIHRTHHKDDPHSGQVAFPGGARDSGDTDSISNALRETYEELGIDPSDVKVLGRLNDAITVTGYRVTPVIGYIPWPYELKLDQREVSRCFTIPLNWLANSENYITSERMLPEPFQAIPVIYYHSYNGEVLWGASARFALNLIAALSDSPEK